MLIYIFRRLVWALMLFFVITLIAFVMFFVLPADSTNGQRNQPGSAGELQTTYNLRGSFVNQYFGFMDRVLVHADLGNSTRSQDAVTNEIDARCPSPRRSCSAGCCSA